jgi:hypothetical protein
MTRLELKEWAATAWYVLLGVFLFGALAGAILTGLFGR